MRNVNLMILFSILLFASCSTDKTEGLWDYTIDYGEWQSVGFMNIESVDGSYQATLVSYEMGTMPMTDVVINKEGMTGSFKIYGRPVSLKGAFEGSQFEGLLETRDGEVSFNASKQSTEAYTIDRSEVPYLLSNQDLPDSEDNIDHAGLIGNWDRESFKRGSRIYNATCINCHGNTEIEGSIPLSLKFWDGDFKGGSDPFSIYQTLTKGIASMPPQVTLTPQQKYDVILYLQQEFLINDNKDAYVSATPGYLAGLPNGSSKGPETKPYHPWSDMDYGNFFINTYELVDEESGIERYHSPGPSPYANEDYSKNNFAYKGIAVRLDEGPGGISKGNTWMIFDHDVLRVAGGWTGEGFIDWNAILLNDRHETYPRTIGKLHFETPVGPGWADPNTGSFKDPRFMAVDGRQFGPLPKKWANYKGLYHFENHIIISYSVGRSDVLEELGMEVIDGQTIFTRTLNIDPSSSALKMKIAPVDISVVMLGNGASLVQEDGYWMLNVHKGKKATLKLLIATSGVDLAVLSKNLAAPDNLNVYTKGGPAHYPEEIQSVITAGLEKGVFAIDRLTPPFDNPWDARMKLSGIDFMNDPNKAVVCTTDGDVWLITGITENKATLKWKRIGSGLFQPLGIKVVDEKIYITCRDQIVLLRDFNGDDETDFYESFNHDHQVSDHFHEFAMGLQADDEGNFYYAKSGRHAREALIPQHGTLLKVSADGQKTDIIATGFRAANGVCINPDGSFIVTDQQGFWNPMNRINWVDDTNNFYGNMWGYDPPKDSSRAAMEPPMVWVDMEFDRSPSELVWVESEKWGPFNGSLLSFSYGFGKIQLVYNEKVNGIMQGGVIDLPDIKFLTGVMRGRFNQADGHLYACGMSAWGTSQMMRGGGLYRVRYTGNPIPIPIEYNVFESGIELSFASVLDKQEAEMIANYEIKTWDLIRSKSYGSDRYNIQSLQISSIELLEGGTRVKLFLNDLKPVDVLTITYDIRDTENNPMKGTLQATIHNLRQEQGI